MWKDLKIIVASFFVVLLINGTLSYLLNREFKWWITVGIFLGFTFFYYLGVRKHKKDEDNDYFDSPK
ncbi:hypothetical protein B795N_13950 [Marinilactibacillus psychrotolerans]|uniref:Uncharacterized protein n=1 Tax=Marinilactibacillus psychrotolerans 42ea TaxID=1255609 RepID=A0A1R4K329_9LACT|nr:hypothetical protein B795N_13950 [Marinilactibacillus psychrotolerans]SJN38423.1 hypothetical protein FM115_07840 [Marinilactibacillus psychrotolerans 42ea]